MTYGLRRLALVSLAAPALIAAAQAPDAVPTLALPPPSAPPPPVVTVPHVIPHLSSRQIDQLRQMLDGAAADGIAPSDDASAAPSGDDTAALVNAAMDYASALHHGRLAPADFITDWGLRPAAYDPWPTFILAVQSDRLAAWIAALPPPYAGYDTLKAALATYRAIDRAGGWPQIAAGADAATLRRRLAIEDKTIGDGDDVATALQRAQRRYGLEPTGLLNAATIAALNVGAHDRVRQIEANMERWRWLPAQLPEHRVQVNIAAAVLTVFDADKPVTSMRAVTGRPGDETPMLSSQIQSIVFNPPWNVPSSIATKELWPKEHAHKGYLAAHGFKVIDTGDGGSRLQQKAGPKSALGKVKFDFANPYGVYLHDTPSQGTFGRYDRLASHGCVRLAHPVDLAKLALQDSPTWTPDAIDDALAKGDTVRAQLPAPISVFLFYWTSYASADGKVSFLDDPYGWDAALADRLKASANRAKQQVALK